ncbi:MAG: gluconokinase [Chthoniobacterales bacterium]
MQRHRTEPAVLALDIGTSSVRTTLFDRKAQPIPGRRASVKYWLRHTPDHGAELDPAQLLRATKRCLRLTKSRLRAVAGSGFWHSLLGLDRAGKPLTPIYTWADSRCAVDAAKLRERFDERVIQQRTGCMLRSSFWPAKLIWLRRTEPKLFRRVARWVSPAEWIFEELFGVRACSHSMASGTGLYDSATNEWDEELLDLLDLTSAKLNPLRDQEDTYFPAIGDGAASNLGSGASTPGIVAINVGTSAAVRVIQRGETPLPFGLFRYVVDVDRKLLGGAVSNAGNLRAWCLRELRLLPNDRKIERLLRAPSARGSRLTILPFWVAERAPTWPEEIPSVVLGLTQSTTAADLLRAAEAAVCHRLGDILDQLESAIGRAEKVIVSGGILQSPASLQILADSLGRDLLTCADQEASLRGAAVHALEQAGEKVPSPKPGRPIRHDKIAAARARVERQRQIELERFFRTATPDDRAP